MTAQNEGYKIMPPMDPKYTERSGLEGPFTTLSGKVVYYDPKEGSYYDPDTDMYMSYDEFRRYDDDYKGMKDERDEVKEAGGYYTQPVYDMIEKHGYEKVMAELLLKLDANVIQDFLNRADFDESVSETLSPEEKKLVAKMYNKDGTLTDLGKRVMGTKESRTLENLMAKVFGKTVNEFEFNPNAGHRDQMSHPENRGLGAEPNRSYSPRPKLRPKNLKAPMTSPRPKARPKDLEMKYAINKAVKQAVGESQFDGHDIMSEDPPNGIDFDYANLSKVNWEQYSEEDIKTFYSIVDNLSFESGIDDSHFNALQWLEKNVMNKTEAQFKEGHSPHKKGSAKYKAHMAAKHASMNEGAVKPKVSVNEMQDALKLKDAPSNEHVVASYVRTMIDESHKTWDDVMEQVEFVLDLVKEGKTMKAEDVFNIVKSQHMQSYFDYKMSLKENLDTLRNIVKDKAYQTVKFEDGSMKVDLTTASMFLQVFDAQKPETQEKIQAKIKTKQGFLAMLDLIYSKM